MDLMWPPPILSSGIAAEEASRVLGSHQEKAGIAHSGNLTSEMLYSHTCAEGI